MREMSIAVTSILLLKVFVKNYYGERGEEVGVYFDIDYASVSVVMMLCLSSERYGRSKKYYGRHFVRGSCFFLGICFMKPGR